MADPSIEPPGETLAERRARLRKLRILGNSENRMKRILEGEKVEASSIPNDISTFTSQKSDSSNCDNVDNNHEYPIITSPPEQTFTPPETDSFSSRESEVLPRKVSMISSPIDYKTLQRSQENNARVNNYLNTFQANIATPMVVLVSLLAIISSYAELNILKVFSTIQALSYITSLQFDVKKGSILKEFFTFLFVYAMFQVLLFLLR